MIRMISDLHVIIMMTDRFCNKDILNTRKMFRNVRNEYCHYQICVFVFSNTFISVPIIIDFFSTSWMNVSRWFFKGKFRCYVCSSYLLTFSMNISLGSIDVFFFQCIWNEDKKNKWIMSGSWWIFGQSVWWTLYMGWLKSMESIRQSWVDCIQMSWIDLVT